MPLEPPVTSTTRGAVPGSVIQSTTPTQHARGGGHPATEADQEEQIPVLNPTVVEGVGERQWDRRRRRVPGAVEHDRGPVEWDPEALTGGVDDPDVGLVGDDHGDVVGRDA